jgi:rare lipoprotein A
MGRHNGRRTASGSRFNERQMTAAHASLPLGTRVRVVREDTGEAVVVTITDRIGTRLRVIDLSRGAAVVLGLIRPGVASVRIEVLEG